MGKNLIILGGVLIVIGLLYPYWHKFNLGKLPGDIVIKREGFRFYFPITTSLVISVVLYPFLVV